MWGRREVSPFYMNIDEYTVDANQTVTKGYKYITFSET